MSLSPKRALPGVDGPETTAPRVVFDAHGCIRDARRRAIARESLDGALLVLINVVFLIWPDAHVPLLSRGESLALLLTLDAAILSSWLLAPRWSLWQARRIARTWSEGERRRVLGAG